MIDPAPTISPEAPLPAEPDKRWPAWMAFFTAGLLPAKLGRRTQNVSFAGAYVVHLVSAVAAAIAIIVLVTWEYLGADAGVWDILPGIREEFALPQEPEARKTALASAIFAVAIIFALVESGYLIIALFLAPWGCGDERTRTAIGRAIRRMWLHTPHALLVILVTGVAAVQFYHIGREYRRHPPWKNILPPPQPTGAPSDSPAWDSYHRAYVQYVAAAAEARSNPPFLLRHTDQLAAVGFLAGGVWWLWGALAVVGASYRASDRVRPSRCQECGYDLFGILPEGRCPECGESAVYSLGPNVRPGAAWVRRAEIGPLRAWLTTAKNAVLQPKRLGRQLRLSQPGGDHRRFIAWALPAIALLAGGGLLLAYYADVRRNPFVHQPEVGFVMAPLVAYSAAVLSILTAPIVAGLVGLGDRLRTKSNLTAGAMQAACYLSGYVLIWVALTFGVIAVVLMKKNAIRDFADLLDVDWGLMTTIAIAAPLFIGLAGYIRLVARITSGVRYA